MVPFGNTEEQAKGKQETDIQKSMALKEMSQAVRVHMCLSPIFIMTSGGLNQPNTKSKNYCDCIRVYIGQKW